MALTTRRPRAPDDRGMIRVDQAWGLFQASFAAHDNHAGYYGATETSGHPDDKWGWAARWLCRSRTSRPALATHQRAGRLHRGCHPLQLPEPRSGNTRCTAAPACWLTRASASPRADAVYAGTNAGNGIQLRTSRPRLPRCLHAQLGSLLEHGHLRCLGCGPVWRHAKRMICGIQLLAISTAGCTTATPTSTSRRSV